MKTARCKAALPLLKVLLLLLSFVIWIHNFVTYTKEVIFSLVSDVTWLSVGYFKNIQSSRSKNTQFNLFKEADPLTAGVEV